MGVRYVLLPDDPLDYSAQGEAELLRTHSPLPVRARYGGWTIYELPHPTPIATPAAAVRVRAMTADGVALRVTRPGRYQLRLRYTPYWRVVSGAACVAPRASWGTELRAAHPGLVRIRFDVSLGTMARAVLGDSRGLRDGAADPPPGAPPERRRRGLGESPGTEIRVLSWNLFHGRDDAPGAGATWRSVLRREPVAAGGRVHLNRKHTDAHGPADRPRRARPVRPPGGTARRRARPRASDRHERRVVPHRPPPRAGGPARAPRARQPRPVAHARGQRQRPARGAPAGAGPGHRTLGPPRRPRPAAPHRPAAGPLPGRGGPLGRSSRGAWCWPACGPRGGRSSSPPACTPTTATTRASWASSCAGPPGWPWARPATRP